MVLKIVIAPNALKDSLTAFDAACAIEKGILKNNPNEETVCIPIADGGDGLLQVVQQALKGEWKTLAVEDPLGRIIQAPVLYCPEKSLVMIELASAAGLALLEEQEYNIRKTSTFGVGQLLNAALDLNVNQIILGIGGSATNDAAMGIASALGVKFRDKNGNELPSNACNLIKIEQIDCSLVNSKILSIKFDIICDVNNPLLGENGAAAIFGPQKGASPEDVDFLEQGLSHFSDIIHRDFQIDVSELEGGGAAGGVGAGLTALFNANLCKGAELVLELLSFEDQIKDADLLITAEGKIDKQTGFGKAPYIAAKTAKKFNVPVYVVAGQADTDCLDELPVFNKLYTLTSREITSDYAIRHAALLMQQNAEAIMRDFQKIKRSE